MSVLNKYIDKVYVINLDRDIDRMRLLDSQLKKLGIEYTRFSAVDGSTITHSKYLTEYCNSFCTNGMKGCALSHRAIWEDVVRNNYSNVCIFEDDAKLSDTFNEDFDKMWRQAPKKYDIFYLGCGLRCTDTAPVATLVNTIQGTTPEQISKNVLSVSGSVGTHAYIISNKCAKLLYTLPIITHIDSQIDLWISKFNLNAYSANPLLVSVFDNAESKSNLAESYPYITNRILSYVPFSDDFGLDWSLSENFMKIGPVNINGLMVSFFICIFILPRFTYIFFGGLLLLEWFVSGDTINTFKFFFVGLLAFLVRFGLKY